MPHSSGGGSHSGGSHSGSSSGGSSYGGSYRERSPITTMMPRQGYRRYSYRHYGSYGGIRYQYVKDTPDSFNWLQIAFLSLFVAIGLVFMLRSVKTIHPIDMASYDSRVVLYDEADYLTDTEEEALTAAFKEFQDKTGITCSLITGRNEDWTTNYNSMENYAYDLYVNHFDDEKHWLFVYTEPASSEENFVDWNWEGMQGNDTDYILTSSATNRFNESLQKYLTMDSYSVGEAFAAAISELTPTLKTSGFGINYENFLSGLGFAIFGLIPLAASLMQDGKRIRKEQKKIDELHETWTYVPEGSEALVCEYCDQVYVKGSTVCPHCGAPLS